MKELSDQEIMQAILERTKELLDQGRRTYGIFGHPLDVRFDKSGIVGGSAGKDDGRDYVNFNLALAGENLDEYLNQIIGHELSHIIVRWTNPEAYRLGKIQPHGYEWQCIMVQCYGLVPARCHHMDTSRTANRMPRNYVYTCTGCHKEFNLTSILHEKIQRGQWRICNVCKSKITYAGEKPEFGLGE